MEDFGVASFKVVGVDAEASISLLVEYVLRDGGEKSILTATGSTSAQAKDNATQPWDDWKPGTTVQGKEAVDLIDLSNVIDMFGLDANAADWDDLVKFFDFNNDGVIGIYDISYVASQIAA
jgi:hypothetical protein